MTMREKRVRTPEQEEESRKMLEMTTRMRSAILGSGQRHGFIKCLKCGGTARFSASPSNGHVHCFCNSCDLGWME
jgi:hypothetical protein